jgi:hypothetical protein
MTMPRWVDIRRPEALANGIWRSRAPDIMSSAKPNVRQTLKWAWTAEWRNIFIFFPFFRDAPPPFRESGVEDQPE